MATTLYTTTPTHSATLTPHTTTPTHSVTQTLHTTTPTHSVTLTIHTTTLTPTVQVMLELGGPRVLTYALSTVGSTHNTFEIPAVTLRTLAKLCLDPETSVQVCSNTLR
jgi:hypothetical protein